MRAKNWLPGVDVVWHGGANGLEYDLEVAAGVDAREIAFDVGGADALRVNAGGALEIATAVGTLVQKPLRVTQLGRELPARYRIDGARVRLELDTYDPSSAVLVDPVITYSTYIGGIGNEYSYAVAFDASGNAYVTGPTDGNFPTTTGAYQTTYLGAGYNDVFVAKLNASGTALVYSTYLGGIDDHYAFGIAVDGSGNAYVTGQTRGSFPTTSGAYQTTYAGSYESFVTKLDASGATLVYSTFLGGNGAVNSAASIAVDGSGDAYVAGFTLGNFPTTNGAYQTTFGGISDGFLTKLNASGTALVYSTYLGGSADDRCSGVAVDASGNAYVAGRTTGSFPTTTGSYQTTFGGSYDVLVTKLNTSGSALVYSTYVGGSGLDNANGIAIDPTGNAYVTGSTTGGYPTTTAAPQTTFGGGPDDAFVSKVNASGTTLVYSTYLGGSGQDFAAGIAVDASGEAYVTGTTSGSYPTTTGAPQTTFGGGSDAFVTKINAAGTGLVYSTYFGGSTGDSGTGIAIDKGGTAYLTGFTNGSFPTTTGAYQTTYGGTQDAFVAALSDADLANGSACTRAAECTSGLCVDGVCCDTACNGQCEACDVTSHVGTCTPVTGAPHSPRAACATTSTCTATCDGTNTTTCTYGQDACASTCANGTEIDMFCDTAGACTVSKSHSCNHLVCADTKDMQRQVRHDLGLRDGFRVCGGWHVRASCPELHRRPHVEGRRRYIEGLHSLQVHVRHVRNDVYFGR